MTGREVLLSAQFPTSKLSQLEQGGRLDGSSHLWPAPLQHQHVPLHLDQVFNLAILANLIYP